MLLVVFVGLAVIINVSVIQILEAIEYSQKKILDRLAALEQELKKRMDK